MTDAGTLFGGSAPLAPIFVRPSATVTRSFAWRLAYRDLVVVTIDTIARHRTKIMTAIPILLPEFGMRMMNVDGTLIDFDEIVAVLPVASNEFGIVLRGGAKILIPGGAPGAAVKLRDKIVAGMNVHGDILRDTQ